MIRALASSTKAIVLSVFIASVLVVIAILAALVVVGYGCKLALAGPGKRGVSDILVERLIGSK